MRAFLLTAVVLSSLTVAHAETVANLPLKAIPTQLPVDRLIQVDESYVAEQIAEGLFDMGEGFQLHPVLAENVSWENGGKILRIKIRSVSFSDNTPVTATEVISSLQSCIKAAESALSVSLQDIVGYSDFASGKTPALAGLKRVSDMEIEIQTVAPSPLLADNLAFSNCFIVKPSKTGSIDLLAGAIATGPYTVKSVAPDSLVLTKRANHYRAKDIADKIVFKATDKYGDFQSLKSWANVILAEGDQGEDPAFNRSEYSELGTYQLVLNNSKTPFNKLDVRRAVAKALDIEALSLGMSWQPDRLQAGLFPFGMRGFKQRTLVRDINGAKALLAQAGFTTKNPLKFSIVMSKSKNTEQEAKLWPKVFSKLPIQVRVELLEQKDLIERRNAGSFDALRIIKSPGSVDGHRLLASYLSNSKFNTPRSKIQRCDSLIRQALKVSVLDERYKIYEQADSCLMANVTLIPLSSVQQGYAYIKKPWKLKRKNRYYLKPYDVSEWIYDKPSDR